MLVFTGCDSTKESKILDFKVKDVKSIEVYKFNYPMEAKGMPVTYSKDIERIINAFTEIKIEGDATDFNISGGEVISFRFNLQEGKEFTIAHWGGILRNLNSINYKVSADSIVSLWDNLDYEKKAVSQSDLPIINN